MSEDTFAEYARLAQEYGIEATRTWASDEIRVDDGDVMVVGPQPSLGSLEELFPEKKVYAMPIQGGWVRNFEPGVFVLIRDGDQLRVHSTTKIPIHIDFSQPGDIQKDPEVITQVVEPGETVDFNWKNSRGFTIKVPHGHGFLEAFPYPDKQHDKLGFRFTNMGLTNIKHVDSEQVTFAVPRATMKFEKK